MNDPIFIVFGILASLAFLIVVGRYIERRAQNKGPLFLGQATWQSRVAALVLSLVFGGFFVLQIFAASQFIIIIPIVAMGLFLYALGFTNIIRSLTDIVRSFYNGDEE